MFREFKKCSRVSKNMFIKIEKNVMSFKNLFIKKWKVFMEFEKCSWVTKIVRTKNKYMFNKFCSWIFLNVQGKKLFREKYDKCSSNSKKIINLKKKCILKRSKKFQKNLNKYERHSCLELQFFFHSTHFF